MTGAFQAGRHGARCKIRAWLRRLRRWCRQAWRVHLRLLRDNPAYATALATLAATVITRTELADLGAALLAGLICVARALINDGESTEY